MKNAVTNSSRSSVTLRVLFLAHLTVHWGLRIGEKGEVQAETQTPSAEWLRHLWGVSESSWDVLYRVGPQGEHMEVLAGGFLG